MSLLTGLASLYGGIGKGRTEKRVLDDRERDNQAALDEQRRESDQRDAAQAAQLKYQQDTLAEQRRQHAASQAGLGLDPNGNPKPLAPLPVGLQPLPLPQRQQSAATGFGPTAPGAPSGLGSLAPNLKPDAEKAQTLQRANDEASRLSRISEHYAQDPSPQSQAAAQRYATLATNARLEATALTTQDYNAARTASTFSQVELNKARGEYWKKKTGVDLQAIQARLQAAQGHDATLVRNAQTAYDRGMGVAGLSSEAAIEGRMIAGYYGLQMHDADNAARRAITDANGWSRQAAAAIAATKDPNAGASFMQQGGFTQGGQGGGSQPSIKVDLGGITLPGGNQGGSGQPMFFPLPGSTTESIMMTPYGPRRVKNSDIPSLTAPQANNTPPPGAGVPPDKFQAGVAAAIADVKSKKKPLKEVIDSIVGSTALSATQRQQAVTQVQAAAGAVPPAVAAKKVIAPLPLPGSPAANRDALATDVGNAIGASNKITAESVRQQALALGLREGTPAFVNYIKSHPVSK